MTAGPGIYTFELRRGANPNTYEGEIRDDWGWVISVRGTLDQQRKVIQGTGSVEPLPGPWKETT